MKIFIVLFALAFAPIAFSQTNIPDTKALSLILADPIVEQQFESHSITNLKIQSMPWASSANSNTLAAKRFTIWIDSFREDDVHNPCMTLIGADVSLLLDHSFLVEVNPLSIKRQCQF